MTMTEGIYDYHAHTHQLISCLPSVAKMKFWNTRFSRTERATVRNKPDDILSGWFDDCVSDNEIQKIILDFGNMLERFMCADDEKAGYSEFDSIWSSVFAMAKSKYNNPSDSLFSFLWDTILFTKLHSNHTEIVSRQISLVKSNYRCAIKAARNFYPGDSFSKLR